MKTLKVKVLILFASLLLVACGTTDDNDVSDDMDENYFLQSLVLDIVGTETEGEEAASVSILVEADYYDHNEVDLIDVEENIDEDVNN